MQPQFRQMPYQGSRSTMAVLRPAGWRGWRPRSRQVRCPARSHHSSSGGGVFFGSGAAKLALVRRATGILSSPRHQPSMVASQFAPDASGSTKRPDLMILGILGFINTGLFLISTGSASP